MQLRSKELGLLPKIVPTQRPVHAEKEAPTLDTSDLLDKVDKLLVTRTAALAKVITKALDKKQFTVTNTNDYECEVIRDKDLLITKIRIKTV